MTTSLAQQLQKLAVPQTSLLKESKERASLLFNPKEAAGLKKDIVYQIGLEGLEDLISKNGVFEEFRKSLFHITSKNFERSIQTKEDNKKVDKAIKRFLLLLSPYFMINSSHKALEWLIYRYMIHEYNRNEVLMLILPYHETNIFVRMLQLLNFRDSNDSFHFLKHLQRPGVHLTKQSLLNHAVSNSGFLKFTSTMVQNIIEVHENLNILTVLFNYYCTVFTGVIEYSPDINENQISQMLPIILNGLSSPIPDYAAATYVVLARLLVKSSLRTILLDKIMEKLSNIQSKHFKLEIVLVMLVVYQSQTHYDCISNTVIKNISGITWFSQCLQYLNLNGNYIYPFLKVLVKKSTEYGLDKENVWSRQLLLNLLDELKLDGFFIEEFLCQILNVLNVNMKYPPEVLKWLLQIIQKLDTQYPSYFDKAVCNVFDSSSSTYSDLRSNNLRKILENSVSFKTKFDILNKLYHPSEDIRQESLKYLANNFEKLKVSEQEFIKSSLYEKLNDESPKIVTETLNLLKRATITHGSSYDNVLLSLLNKKNYQSQEWKNIFSITLDLLIKDRPFDWKIFSSIFPYFMLNPDKCINNLKDVFKSPFFTKSILFQDFYKDISNITADDFCNRLILRLENKGNFEIIDTLLKSCDVDSDICIANQYTIIFLLSKLIPVKCSAKIALLVLQHYKALYLKSKHIISNKATPLGKYPEISLSTKFSLTWFKEAIKTVVTKVSIFNEEVEHIDFSNITDLTCFLKLSCSLIFNDHYSIDDINNVLGHFCNSANNRVNFALNVLCANVLDNYNLSKIESYIEHILKKHHSESFSFSDINNYLLTLLAHSNKSRREIALKIMMRLVKVKKESAESLEYITLFKGFTDHFEEIMFDAEQTSLIAFNLLATNNQNNKKRSSLDDLITAACSSKVPVYVKSGILTVVSHINNFDILEQLSDNVLNILEESQTITNHKALICEKIINRIEPYIIPKITVKTKVWKFIEYTIRNNKDITINDQKTCLNILVINQLSKEIYSRMPEDLLEQLLDIICEASTHNQHPEVLSACNRFFKHLDLDAKLIVKVLEKMRDVQSNKIDPARKKRRISIAPTVDILTTLEWKKGVCILEFIQDKKKIRNSNCLIGLLFSILKKCLDFQEQEAVEYTKQLILSLILLICTKIDIRAIPENAFNLELVIQCIRASQNPQTHHHALMLLADAAQIVPTEILHHIMTIFTFMGSSVLRYDDAYSFQIIIKIIDSIIPILLKQNNEMSISNILQVFVDALLDVPEHRRIPLYKQLLTNVSEQQNLYVFLLLIFERQVLHSQEKHKQNKDHTILDIALTLCLEFPSEINLNACLQLINFIKQLPDEKGDNMDATTVAPINIENYNPKQFRHYKYVLMGFIKNLLTTPQFVNKIVVLSNDENMKLEKIYKDLIVSVLTCIQKTQKATEKAANTPQAQYWKIMLHHAYDILDSINALLTPNMFLLVIKGLTMYDLCTVKRRALELLNTKLQHNYQYFEDCDRNDLYILIPPIISIIELLNTDDIEVDQEILVQTALLSLKLLVKALASDDPEKFVRVLEFISNLLGSGKAQNNVLASVILCLAELCANLRVHAISCLPDIMPSFLKILKCQKHQNTSNLLLISVVTAVNKLLDSFPLFLSPYLKKIVFEMSILTTKWDCTTDDQKLLPLVNKLVLIKQKIGSLIPSRILIPVIEDTYATLVAKKYYKAVGSLMDILSECFKNLTSADLNSNIQELTNFFLQALKFRCENQCSIDDANLVETHIVKALNVLILKLSETSFRPLYFKIYEWAVRSEEKSERLITFYNLSMTIANSLKGLFVLFAGHFLNNAAQIITDINKLKPNYSYFDDETKDILLLENVLTTLQAVFSYDNQKFINRDRFDILMQPLVDQIENDLGGVEALESRNERLLTPTIVHFLLAVSDDVCWKQMNYQILLKMRSSSPDIRLFALHCLKEVVTKLGQDFLPLLPETIPFLAELLEDEEEKVEKACQKAIHEMEVVLGEPLQKYF
ncbi:HEAT repeat containing 1 homolog l(2)k09022 [Rhynchophorus ferrugineus]|uniref:HEAT repeat containing 1 homolog l(2)k09022 n=1 Tax=Rhynchophorus ferrugineus TaxID=354439 RepID=UPI003FCCD6F0